MRKLYSPTFGLVQKPTPLAAGGTSAETADTARTSLGLLAETLVGSPGGVATLTGNYLTESEIPSTVTAKTHLTGPKSLTLNIPTRYIISNYNSKSIYDLDVPVDLLLDSQSGDSVTLTALTPGDKTFSINDTVYTLPVGLIKPERPSLIVPVYGAVDMGQEVTISLSQFQMPSGFEGTDSHKSTDWQLSTDGNFSTISHQSLNDSVNLLNWAVSGLSPNTTYYIRARHNGIKTGASEWTQLNAPDPNNLSTSLWFSTKSSFVASAEQRQISVADSVGDEYLGWCVALTADGNHAFISSPQHESIGCVFVFNQSNSLWSVVARLKPSDVPTSTAWGQSMAISAYGEVVLIGGSDANSVYCYVKVGSSWNYRQTLSDTYGGLQQFGYAISVSGDGSTCCISQRGYDSARGAAHIYIRIADTWQFQTRITLSDGALYDYFGESVAMAYDGSTLVVGAKGRASKGAVFIYRRSSGVWSLQSSFVSSVASSSMGTSVSISADGNTVIAGAPYANSSRGAAMVYKFNGTSWSLQTTLLAKLNNAAETGIGLFGYSVAIAPNGLTCVVGAISRSSNGAIYIYSLNGSTWTQAQRMLAPANITAGYFGYSVATVNGSWLVLASAPYATNLDGSTGTVCTFV